MRALLRRGFQFFGQFVAPRQKVILLQRMQLDSGKRGRRNGLLIAPLLLAENIAPQPMPGRRIEPRGQTCGYRAHCAR